MLRGSFKLKPIATALLLNCTASLQTSLIAHVELPYVFILFIILPYRSTSLDSDGSKVRILSSILLQTALQNDQLQAEKKR
jgi:hypothetical protein